MGRRIPLTLILISGTLGIIPFLVPHRTAQEFNDFFLNQVLRIIGAFAFVLGLGSLIRYHTEKIRRHRENWEYSWVTLISLLITAFIGLFGGFGERGLIPMRIGEFQFDIQTLFMRMLVPLGSTMFALLAFFMASAAYRAFRARTLEATLLLVAAFFVMLGMIPLGEAISGRIPEFAQWILDVPTTTAMRGIRFGVALGAIATSLKIILGIERGWLGGGS